MDILLRYHSYQLWFSDPDNGTVLISSSTEGGVATYFCDDEYELEGNTSRVCLPDGQWSGNETFCKGTVHLHVIGMYKSHIQYTCHLKM